MIQDISRRPGSCLRRPDVVMRGVAWRGGRFVHAGTDPVHAGKHTVACAGRGAAPPRVLRSMCCPAYLSHFREVKLEDCCCVSGVLASLTIFIGN